MHLLTKDRCEAQMKLASYNYRYFLPYAPEWGSPDFCERRLQELLCFCRDTGIDAVQFFVNTRPGTYYMPAVSAESQRHWAAWMNNRVAPAIRDAGMSYQLNFQVLLGAGSNRIDLRGDYGWECLVNQHGEETLGCACPLGPVFRAKMGEMLRMWAQTKPDVLWIDDDFRMHQHGLSASEFDFYCYCDLHLDAFAECVGRHYSREEIVEEILKPGTPSGLRTKWFDHLDGIMVDAARWIREQVHGVSPQTRLALMTSVPDVHSVEGRDWDRLLNSLCGPYTPITRPCSGVYTGTASPIKDQTVTYRLVAHSIATLEQSLGVGNVEFAPELENTRFTTWCKSASNTEFVLVQGQLLGCPQITLSMNDLEGSPLDEEPMVSSVLQSSKPRLDALARLDLSAWDTGGVCFLCDPDSARKTHLKANSRMQDLGLLRHWEDAILQMGVAGKYASAEQMASSEDITVLEEYTAWCPSDEEMERILSGAVLLDGGAARVLQERGFGEYLGLEVGDHLDYFMYSEVYLDGALPGVHSCRMPHRGIGWYELKSLGARIVSQFVDSRNERHPGSAIYENSLGGRVAVYAGTADSQPNSTFGSHAGRRWLHGTLRWLSRERISILPCVPHHALSILQNREDEHLIALANLGTDVLSEVSFLANLEHPIPEVLMLSDAGNWENREACCRATDTPGRYMLSIPCHLNAFNWLVFRFRQRV